MCIRVLNRITRSYKYTEFDLRDLSIDKKSKRYDFPLSTFIREKNMVKFASLHKSTRYFNISQGFWLMLIEG